MKPRRLESPDRRRQKPHGGVRMKRVILSCAALAAVIALALAGSAPAIPIGLPADGSQVNDDPAKGIDPDQNAGVSDVVGGSLMRAARRVRGRPSSRSRRVRAAHLRARVQERRVGDAGRLAQHRPASRGGGAVDRLRRAQAHRAVGRRGTSRASRSAARSRSSPAASAPRRRVCAAANTWVPEGQDRGAGIPSLNIHTDKRGREPVRRRRRGRRGQRPRAVGRLAGAGRQRRRRRRTRPDLRLEGRQAGAAGAAVHGLQALGRREREPLLLAAGRARPAGRERRLVGDRRPHAERRPEPQRHRARHRVHRRRTTPSPGRSGTRRARARSASAATSRSSRPRSSPTRRRRRLPLAGGRQRHRRPGQPRSTRRARTPSARAPPPTRGRGRLLAEQGPDRGRRGPARRRGHADARQPRPCRGSSGPRTSAAAGTRSSSRGWSAATTSSSSTAANPVSNTANDATRPDITFFGNVPYLSWIETVAARRSGLRRATSRTRRLVLDTPGGLRLTAQQTAGRRLIDFRVPISSSCTADPFTADGSACPVAALNAPFFLFTTAGSPQRLFGQATVGGPNCAIFTSCKLVVHIRHGRAKIIARLRQRTGSASWSSG